MAYFRLARPVNVFIAGLSVIIMASLMPVFPPACHIIYAVLTVILLNSAANALNDITDLEIDRINRPNRPLPAGKLTLKQAGAFSLILFVGGNVLSYQLDILPFIISAFIATPLMILYSLYFKPLPFWGNLTIAFILGLAMIYSASAFGHISYGIAPAFLAFLINLIREIVKDIEDMEGDKQRKSRTLPLRFGVKYVRFILALLTAMLILAIPLPWYYNIYNDLYLLLCLPLVSLPLIVIFSLFLSNKELNYRKISNMLKLSMLMGLIAIYAGS